MKKRYSIAIYPPDEIMDLVKEFKDRLAKLIGWFHSRNAKAHITIIEFEADHKELLMINDFLVRFCASKSPFSIQLNEIKNYLNGTFLITPDPQSKTTTKGFMKQLQKDFPIKSTFASRDPHLSIARHLDQQNIQIAHYLIQEVKAAFDCNSIVLRELRPDFGQFIVIAEYTLQGDGDFPYNGGQLSLGFE